MEGRNRGISASAYSNVGGIDCDDGADVEVCCAIVKADWSSSAAMTLDLLFLCVFLSARVCETIVSEFNLDRAARPLPMPWSKPITVFRRVVPLHDGFDL